MPGNWQLFENLNREPRIVNRLWPLRCAKRPMSRFNESRVTHQSRAAQALLRSGDISVVSPPVPIPNTEVKRCSPDGSTATGRARVGRRQNKNPAGFPVGFLVSGVRLLLEHGAAERRLP